MALLLFHHYGMLFKGQFLSLKPDDALTIPDQ